MTVRLGCVSGPAFCHEVQLKVTDGGAGFDVQAATQGRHSGMGLTVARASGRRNGRRPHGNSLVCRHRDLRDGYAAAGGRNADVKIGGLFVVVCGVLC